MVWESTSKSNIEKWDSDKLEMEMNLVLRNYQVQLMQHAKKKNSIIFLPTGAGKSLIAVHVLFSKTQEINKPYPIGKRAFFIVNTKVMVLQMAKLLTLQSKFNVGYYTGDMNVDLWSREIWLSEFKANHVLVMTADILKHILMLKFIDHTNISLLVFDECHHANQSHPYKLIMNSISEVNDDELPLILGLTSTLLISSPKHQVSKELKSLEISLRSQVISADEIDEILSVSADPEDILVQYDRYDTSRINSILNVYKDAIEAFKLISGNFTNTEIDSAEVALRALNQPGLKYPKKFLVNSQDIFLNLGPYCGSMAALHCIILCETLKMKSADQFQAMAFICVETELNKVRRMVAKTMGEDETFAVIYENSSPKVRKLIDVIYNFHNSNSENIRLLIFVHQRLTALVLSLLFKRLKAVSRRFESVEVDFITSKSQFGLVSNNKVEDIIYRFSSGELNVLFATNVLEEGIDISACNVVISFDFPLNYKSYFQSRGRARTRNSKYYIFVDEGEPEKIKLLKNYRELKDRLHQLVLNRREGTDEMGNGSTDDDDKEDEEEIYLRGRSMRIKINGILAISVVAKYCHQLPQDRFSLLSPIVWYQKTEAGAKKAFLQMPVNSPIKEIIEGAWKNNISLAKKSVYLRTLVKLHEMNELDDDLNAQKINFDNFKNLFRDDWTKSSTENRKRLYEIQFAECLKNCMPLPGQTVHLHVLKFVWHKYERSRHRVLHGLVTNPCTYGLITSKELSRICQFPLFFQTIPLDCDLLVNHNSFVLTPSELSDIKNFHFSLFRKVLNTLKDYQIFDGGSGGNSYFVVPLQLTDEKYTLDWDVINCDFLKTGVTSFLVNYNPSSENVRKSTAARVRNRVQPSPNSNKDASSCQTVVPLQVPDDGQTGWEETREERNFVMTELNYTKFVISPNYRGVSQFYVVSSICHELSPMSPFPKMEFDNYFDYYKEKYGIKITNKEQPLLHVAVLPNCNNFKTDNLQEDRKGRNKYHEEYFIPELCNIYPFPKYYWAKALLVPSFLNRISSIYLAEELRRKIVGETGLGLVEIPDGRTWNPLVEKSVHKVKEEKENSFSANPGHDSLESILTLNLPLTQLKSKVCQKNSDSIVDPERNIFEFGLCDLENWIQTSTDSADFLDYESRINALRSNNSAAETLKSIGNLDVPELKLLKTCGNDLGVELVQIVQACTSKGANEIVNYERLELLGDSFLKFSVSLYLFKLYPKINEGKLTALKGKLVGNKNLFDRGLTKNLQKFINALDFSPTFDWNPPLFGVPEELLKEIVSSQTDSAVLSHIRIPEEEQISGRLSAETLETNRKILADFNSAGNSVDSENIQSCSLLRQESIKNKTIADVVEALIGAYLLEYGLVGGFEIVNWFGILPRTDGSYDNLMKTPFNLEEINFVGADSAREILMQRFSADLEDLLDYKFENKALLLQALTHSSCTSIRTCYQRLEFLGDAILDLLITIYIYENGSDSLSPGQMTDIRSSLVNNIVFACLTVRYDIHKYIFSESSPLTACIGQFVELQVSRKHVIDENVQIILRESDSSSAETVSVPKPLGDVFESLAGAIYLDSGNSLETVWRVCYRLMGGEIEKFMKDPPKNAIRLLHEICRMKPYFEANIVDRSVSVTCTVEFNGEEITTHGWGKNKREAKLCACRVALNKILKTGN